MKERINHYYTHYLYYGLIIVISFLVLVFVPLIGSDANLGFSLPNTSAAWAIYIVKKLLVSVLNVMIFYCFMEQAKVNVKDNESYKAAKEILAKEKVREYIPRSPGSWQRQQYISKGVTIFLSTAVGTIALTNAILTYDYMSLLTYILVIFMGVVFGILQMKKAEEYWTTEFYDYAKTIQHEKEEAERCLQKMAKNTEI